LWGLAGYTVFFLAPALKLPPELPGAASDGLQTRQFWWIATVLCSALGLVGLVFCKSTMLKLLGGVILVLPHLLSGPQHQAFAGSVPDLLAHQFVIAVGTVNLLFWLSLGLATSWSFRLTHADAQR
jgi:cobalt transporter subunit CbtA